MTGKYTAIIQRDGKWWIAWIKEVPGVNAQARTRKQCLENLRITLKEVLEWNRAEALDLAAADYEEVSIEV